MEDAPTYVNKLDTRFEEASTAINRVYKIKEAETSYNV